MNVQKVITHPTTTDDAAPSGSVGFPLSNIVTANRAEIATGVEVDFQPTSGGAPILGAGVSVKLQLYIQNADGSWSTSGVAVTVNGGDKCILPFRASSTPLVGYVRATSATGCDGFLIRIGETVRFDRYGDAASTNEADLRASAATLTAPLAVNAQKVTNVATPTASSDAATKGYVDSQVTGQSPKEAVRVATTGSIANLGAVTTTIDGQLCVNGDRVLVKDTASIDGVEGLSGKRNGIYVFSGIVGVTGALTRATDADTAAEIAGASVLVEEGTVNSGTQWSLPLAVEDITLETTVLTFVKTGQQILTGTPVALTATAPAAGSASTLSKSDHDHGVQGLQAVIDFALGHSGNATSTTALTTSHVVYRVRIKVTTQFSAGATLDIGQTGHTTDFGDHTTDTILADLSQIPAGGTYDIEQRTAVAAALPILATLGGSPAAGAGFITVFASVPLP